MSESFRSIRHLTAYVDQEVTRFTQLQDAIKTASAILDSLPEKERQVREAVEKLAEIELKIGTAQGTHETLLYSFKKQRQEMADLVQKEQQERVTAREAFKDEQHQWRGQIEGLRKTLHGLEQEIQAKKQEIANLEEGLASTVKAVLRR